MKRYAFSSLSLFVCLFIELSLQAISPQLLLRAQYRDRLATYLAQTASDRSIPISIQSALSASLSRSLTSRGIHSELKDNPTAKTKFTTIVDALSEGRMNMETLVHYIDKLSHNQALGNRVYLILLTTLGELEKTHPELFINTNSPAKTPYREITTQMPSTIWSEPLRSRLQLETLETLIKSTSLNVNDDIAFYFTYHLLFDEVESDTTPEDIQMHFDFYLRMAGALQFLLDHDLVLVNLSDYLPVSAALTDQWIVIPKTVFESNQWMQYDDPHAVATLYWNGRSLSSTGDFIVQPPLVALINSLKQNGFVYSNNTYSDSNSLSEPLTRDNVVTRWIVRNQPN